MAIKVLKRQQSVSPVGIIKSDTFDANAELAKDIANTATNMMGQAYQQGAEEARKTGIERANQVKIKTLNPEEGFVQTVNAPETFGRIATASFENVMNKRYVDSIESSMRLELKKFSLDPNNIDMMDNPALYQEKATELVAGFVKASPQQFQGTVKQFGTKLISAGLTDVAVNQHKNAMKKITSNFVEDMNVNIIEMNNIVSNSVDTGDYTDAVTKYNDNDAKIDEMQPLLSDSAYRQLKDANTFNYVEQAITSHMSGLNKAQAEEVAIQWRENAWIQGNMDPVIQQAMDSIPKTGRFRRIKEGMNRTINSLLSMKKAESTMKVGDYGSAGNADVVLAEAQKINGLTFDDGSIDYSKPQYKELVEKYGEIDKSLADFAGRYLAGTMTDPDGTVGFRLYQLWNNLAYTRGETGMGDVLNDKFFTSKNAQEFHKVMTAVDKYMQIDTNEEQFVKAITHYRRSQSEKKEWVLAIGQDLGIKEPTEKDIRNQIMTTLINDTTFSSPAMSKAEAENFVDEVILYQAMSVFDGTNLSTADAIAKIRETVKDDFQEDDGMINPNGMRAYSSVTEKIPNPDAGKVAGIGGMYGKSPEYFERTTKFPTYMKTRFALKSVFDRMGFPDGAERFKKHIEDVVKISLGAEIFDEAGDIDDVFESPNNYKYAKNIFIQPQRNSTVENPFYNVFIKDTETGELQPLVINGHQLALRAEDFKMGLKREEFVNKEMADSIASKGLIVNKLASGQLDTEAQIRITNEFKSSRAKYEKILKANKNFGTRLTDAIAGSGSRVGATDLLNIGMEMQFGGEADSLSSDLFVDEETVVEQTISALKEVPDHVHKIIFGRDSRYPVGAGIESLERNNPTNIRFNRSNQWKGKMGDDGSGFETFEDNTQAFRATAIILKTYNKSYFKMKMTVPQMLSRWAPPSENDTQSYIDHVLDTTGLDKDDVIDTSDEEMMLNIIKVMTKHEIGANNYNSYNEWDSEILDGIRMANQ